MQVVVVFVQECFNSFNVILRLAMKTFQSLADAAQYIINETGGDIRLGIPLGLGKPNQLVNALYQAAVKDASLKLSIFTALSLEKPSGKSALEKRFLDPFAARVFGDYVDLDYIKAIKKKQLPSNITVNEFFVRPGAELGNAYTQQHYMSSNYTHAARDLNNCGINVLAQIVASEIQDGEKAYSLSCNPEVTLDLIPLIEKRRAQGEKILIVGQVNNKLPFIENHAQVSEKSFDVLIDDENCHSTLFSTPNMPVNMAEHFVGLNASTLVKDNGTLQIGIGALGDAVAYALLLRDKDNINYQHLVQETDLLNHSNNLIQNEGGLETFFSGLYGCSEMFTYGLFRLIEENIIRRTVKDKEGRDIFLHGGFFLGPKDMYARLKTLSVEVRKKIDLLNISYVNALYGDEAIKRTQRQDARFINTAFSMTLMGAAISDQLEDGRVLSGVGGQYNFVAQAHELEGARSILLLRASRSSGGEVSSNIVWSYGHTTIPRHLRDIVITEYGIADLRSQSDSECIKRMLNIADSRFQDELMQTAKANGKLEADYQIPEAFRNNFPERLQKIYQQARKQNLFPDFPLGSDFDELEQDIIQALTWLKAHVKPSGFLELARRLVVSEEQEKAFAAHLKRMDLDKVSHFRERLYRQLVLAALSATQKKA